VKLCLFASDLHGRFDRYEKLFHQIETLRPAGVFLGGDLTASMHPSRAAAEMGDFFRDFLADRLDALRRRMHPRYPRVFSILGNDDGKIDEAACEELTALGLWSYIDNRRVDFAGHDVYGYACVPPTPFALKDWERYDVSRYVPHGSVSPEEGFRSVPVDPEVIRYATIADDLRQLAAGQHPMDRAVFLFHTPPHETNLDRAALDGKQINGVPLDLHVGSIAVRRFIESSQPLLTLHGHIHESARLTGSWRDRIGRTHAFSAAHDGPELALVRFDLDHPHGAERLLR
jgi:Icc-related predicted phosphoesterase